MKVTNNSSIGLNSFERMDKNGWTHTGKQDDIRGAQLIKIHKKKINVYS